MNVNTEYESQDKENLIPSRSTGWIQRIRDFPARYVLTLLGFLGFCNVYALRVNLSVAIVSMVNQTAMASRTNASNSDECPVFNNSDDQYRKDGEFLWDSNVQGTILGSFFYGYLVTQIPGGRMAELFGGKWLFGIGVLCTSVLTLLTPIAARWGVGALIVLRVLEGLGEGVTFPAMHAMLGRWLPRLERSMLSTIIYSGAQIGTVIAMPISGLLCGSNFLGGWPSVFYVFGFFGCLWFIVWSLVIYETPEQHPRISRAELMWIQDGKIEKTEKLPIPWKAILTSIPVWTLMFTHFGQNWGFYMFLTELPTYLSAILHFSIKSNGGLSALPYLLQAIVSWIVGYASDFARQKQYFTVSTIRKLCNTVGFFGPAICMIGVILAGCNGIWSMVFLTLAMGFNGCIYSGFMVTHVDMAPDFAGTLMGMSNAFATMAGFLVPKAVGALTLHHQTLARWRTAFLIAMTVYFVTGVLFIVFGSATSQKWGVSRAESPSPSEKKAEKDSDPEEN